MNINPSYAAVAFVALCQIIVSRFINRMSYDSLAALRLRLRPRVWEAEGEIYQRVFRIRSWKDYVPSVGPFDKKDLKGGQSGYISVFILETVRAEFAHLSCLAIAYAVSVICRHEISWIVPAFFTVINLPCIMIQRYNRPRFEKVLRKRGSPLIIPEDERKPRSQWIRNRGRM